jgi:putative ubiquitin-RnfH superfamily antitoxin RatB of RatAB toxin-antitoxin module
MQIVVVRMGWDSNAHRATVEQQRLAFDRAPRVDEALQAAGWRVAPELPWTPSVWGKAVALDAMLKDGDRLELSRPLKVDPKTSRAHRVAAKPRRGWVARQKPINS